MKKVIIVSAALLIGLTSAIAQTAKPVEKKQKLDNPKDRKENAVARKEKKQERMTEMDEVVRFTEEQRGQIEEINKSSSDKMKEVRMKYKDSEDKTAMRNEMKKLQEERMTKTRSVMNEEQKSKWKAHQKSKRNTAPKQE